MDRNAFFKTSGVPYAETLQASFEVEESLQFTIQRPIVEVIIGRLLFHEDDQLGVSYARAMAIFENKEGVFVVEEKRPSRFRLCVEYMSAGVTFRMAAKIMQATKKETGLSRLGGYNAAVAAKYARIVCAASLELLSQFISTTWGFSLALDCATHQSKSYVDVRCRFSVGAELHNVHLLAIPLFDRHTAVNIFSVVEQFLDALIPKWRRQLLGVATDGAATMVGNTGGVATLMEQECTYDIVRVWCGLHQLDLKMQIVFDQALNEGYMSKLIALISYLRRQQNLITKMRTICPKVANTRWLSMFQVAHWLCEHAFTIRNYLHTKKATCAPNSMWWIFLFALREVARESNAVFISLQGLSTLVKQQQDRFEGLVSKLCSNSGMLGPLDPRKLKALDDRKHEKLGRFVISHAAAHAHVTSLDLWVCDSLDELPTEQKQSVIVAVARTYVLMASGIDDLIVAKTSAYPVTPRSFAPPACPNSPKS